MAQDKTKPTDAGVATYLSGIDDPGRRSDCESLVPLISRVTGESPRMWGPSIVGFGVHAYRYESGREGETCRVGFSSRNKEIAFYGLLDASEAETSLSALGKHRRGKGCLYVARLSDIDVDVLERLVVAAGGT